MLIIPVYIITKHYSRPLLFVSNRTNRPDVPESLPVVHMRSEGTVVILPVCLSVCLSVPKLTSSKSLCSTNNTAYLTHNKGGEILGDFP